MTIFLLSAAVMFAIVFWLILTPLLKKHGTEDESELESSSLNTNITIGRERLNELKADLTAGRIDSDQFETMRGELEQTVLDAIAIEEQSEQAVTTQKRSKNLWLVLVLTIAVPVITLGVYNEVGNTSFLNPEVMQEQADEQAVPDIEAMVEGLATRLEKNPEDGQGWQLLGRSYLAMQRFTDSAKAYAKAYEIQGESADLLANYADAIGRSENNDLTGAAKPLIKRALQLDPSHVKAQWMSGMLAYQEQDYENALLHLQPMLEQMEVGSEAQQGMVMLIDRIKNEQKQSVSGSSPDQPPSMEESNSVAVQVSISLEQALQEQVSADDTVYIFAKAASGPPMPLAVAKVRAADLPLTVTLDDSMAMRPDLTISSHDRINLTARISKSGNPIAAAGDLQGGLENILATDQKVHLITINQQLK